MSKSLTVLVTGATGQQGGAAARVLNRDGHKVRAMSRQSTGGSAASLEAAGIEVVQANFDDAASLQRAAEGVDAVYLMSTPFEAGTDAEAAHGKAAIDAFKAAGVGHIVFSSVASADQATGIPHFDSKYEIEQYLAASGVPYTISAPVWFMDNVHAPFVWPSVENGQLALAMPATRKLQQVAVKDIGEFGARLIERRESVFGKRYDIAGDELSPEETAAQLSSALGREITAVEVPLDAVRQQSEDMALMFEWFDRVGYSADIASLKRDFPEVGWQTFAQWLESQEWGAARAA